MIRTFVVSLGLATLLLASCTGAPSPTPTPTARIVVFTANAERTPRNQPVTLIWQAADAGVQDGLPSCLVTRRIGDDNTESTLQATCTGSMPDVPPAPLTATTVHYQFKVLKQPADASEPYLTQTRSVTLDPALYAVRAGGADFERATAVTTLPDGSAIVTGQFIGTASFGPHTLTSAGGSDVFVARIDANGTWTWARRAGGTGDDEAWGVTALPDGSAIVAGRFSGTATFGSTTLNSAGSNDAFVARINANGTWTWARRAGGTSSDVARGVSALPDGGAIVTGYFNGTATFGSTPLTSEGNNDVFVARIDPNGAWTWARRAGGTGTDIVAGVSALPDGGAIVTGYFNGTATFGGTTISAGSDDVFVARIDAGGTWTWARRAGGTGGDRAWGVSALPDGGAIVTGTFDGTAFFGSTTLNSAGSTDVFVARIDPNGTWTWARRAGGTGSDRAFAVSVLPDGGAIVTGEFTGTTFFGSTALTSAGDLDAFVARIDEGGTWTWATRAGGTGFELGNGVSALPDGGAIVAGQFNGTASFGPHTLTSAGGSDVFVARIGANGAW